MVIKLVLIIYPTKIVKILVLSKKAYKNGWSAVNMLGGGTTTGAGQHDLRITVDKKIFKIGRNLIY